MIRTERIRVVAGPWPERIGCLGWIVEPDGPTEAKRYPHAGRGRREVVIVLDADPLNVIPPPIEWSCALDRTDVEPADA